jgi:hypothetical protein
MSNEKQTHSRNSLAVGLLNYSLDTSGQKIMNRMDCCLREAQPATMRYVHEYGQRPSGKVYGELKLLTAEE